MRASPWGHPCCVSVFLDYSQKYISWYYFRTLERTGEDRASLGGGLADRPCLTA